MRALRKLKSGVVGLCVMGGVVGGIAAPSAQGVEVYKRVNRVWTRVLVPWQVLSNTGSTQGVCSLRPDVTITPRASDPMDVEVRLATQSFNADEQGYQPIGMWIIGAEMPPADAYCIVFNPDVSTWDAYNSSGGPTSPWDSFLVHIGQFGPYYTLVDPCGEVRPLSQDPIVQPWPGGSPVIDSSQFMLEGTRWCFGGDKDGDGVLDSARVRSSISVAGDPTKPYFLNIALDTVTLDSADERYPSWGMFGRLDRCEVDFDGDTTYTGNDLQLFLNGYAAGDLISDMDNDGDLDQDDLDRFDALAANACGPVVLPGDWPCVADVPEPKQEGCGRQDYENFEAHWEASFANGAYPWWMWTYSFVHVIDLDGDLVPTPEDLAIYQRAFAGCCQGFCRADYNFDGVCGLEDLVIFQRLMQHGWMRADLNMDGVLDLADQTLMTTLLGTCCQ